MSLRGIEAAPVPAGPPEPDRRKPLLIAAVVVLALVAGVTVAAAMGRLQLPFLARPTVTRADDAFSWTLTFPKVWAATEIPTALLKFPVRYEASGAGVGVRVQAFPLTGEEPASAVNDKAVTDHFESNEKSIPNRPDLTFLEGPGHGGLATGSVGNVPFVHFLETYTDFSSGVPVLLEDSVYYFFSGAALEQVTFEVAARNYQARKAEFDKAIRTWHSKYIAANATPSTGPLPSPSRAAPSPSASAAPSAAPSVTPTATSPSHKP